MRILYGINGEGLGHYNRSKEIIQKLKENHQVRIASYGTCKNIADFQINGVSLDLSNGLNKSKAIKDFLKLNRDQRINYFPDLVITDYEPTTAYFARRNNIPLVSIDNQHRFSVIDHSLPLKLKFQNYLLKWFNKVFIGPVDEAIYTSFYKIGNSCNPIIENIDYPNYSCNYNVAYLKGSYLHSFCASYNSIRPCFIFSNEKIKEYKNIIANEIDNKYFKRLLSRCNMVFCHAGHQLISEILHLQRNVVLTPIKGQPEQEINYFKYHQMVEKKQIQSGLTEVMNRLNKWLR